MTTKTTTKTVGVKRQLHDLFKAGKRGTLEQLVKLTGGTESNVRTAMTDLKNPTYAIDGKPLAIVNVDGVYGLKAAAKPKRKRTPATTPT